MLPPPTRPPPIPPQPLPKTPTMPTDLIVPEVGESITEVEIGQWLKSEGDAVAKDDPLVEIETDKVTLELPAPEAGTILKITHPQGTPAKVGDVIGTFEAGGSGNASTSPSKDQQPTGDPQPAASDAPVQSDKAPPSTGPGTPSKSGPEHADADDSSGTRDAAPARSSELVIMPAAQRLISENNLDPTTIPATGPGGRLLKEDVQNHLKNGPSNNSTPHKEARDTSVPGSDTHKISNTSATSEGGRVTKKSSR